MPGEELIGTIISSLTSLFGGIINTASTNKTNRQLQEQANQTNIALSAQSNKAAKQEAELAYQRSLPTQQVRNMQMAGMSKAGAINALNGGGSYTPAPVNTAQVEAPQVAGLDASLFTNLASIMSAERMQKKELKAQEAAQKAQIESNERIAQLNADTTNRNADNRLKHDELVHKQELQFKQDDLQFRKEQYEYSKKLVDSQKLLTDAQRNKINAELEDFKSSPAKSAREAEYQLKRMSALYNYNVTENEFYKYLRDNFVKGEDGNYYPIAKTGLGTYDQGAIGTLNDVESVATAFWNLMFSIIPVRPLLDCIKLFGK